MPTVEVTALDQANGTALVNIQDGAGNALAERFRVRTWAATADYGTTLVTGTYVVGTGSLLHSYVTDKDLDIITDAAGAAALTLTAANDTYYVMTEIDGRIYSDEAAISGN